MTWNFTDIIWSNECYTENNSVCIYEFFDMTKWGAKYMADIVAFFSIWLLRYAEYTHDNKMVVNRAT